MSLRERRRPLRVLMVASEMAPFAKVGGLADVVGALAPAVRDLGVDVRAVLPLYAGIDATGHGLQPDPEVPRLVVRLAGTPYEARFHRAMDGSGTLPVSFIASAPLFGRAGVYDDPATGEGYPDNPLRFLFFVRAAQELFRGFGWRPDVVHCHDHQTAPFVADLRGRLAPDPFYAGVATVLTIHNLGFQGLFDPEATLPLLGIRPEEFVPLSPYEFFGKVNWMKAGIVHADRITTVSPRYAREITESEEFGAGLEGVLRERGADLVGILNGADYAHWDPAVDKLIPRGYGPDDLSGKWECRAELRRRFGLAEPEGRVPVIGMVSRLADQKGFDLLASALPRLMETNVQLAVLGTGQERYRRMLEMAAGRYRGNVGVMLKFDDALAHLVEAGSDMFLMPSRYEPCGLNQIYSLRYGTVPVVRETGGLADTVQDDDVAPGQGTGFVFRPYDPAALLDAVDRARRAFDDERRWESIVRRGMRRDFSWKQSARRYVETYEEAVDRAAVLPEADGGRGPSR